MKHTLTIAKREMTGIFYSPIAYVVLCLFTILSGILFATTTFDPRLPAEMRSFFFSLVFVLVFITPAISMRLMSEELRSGTIETLMTNPISDTAVILGKWLGALGFYIVLLSPTLIYVLILSLFSNPDPGPIISGYIGLLLVGSLYLAMGICASVMTKSQIIAFVVTLFGILFFTFITYLLHQLLPTATVKVVYYVNINRHYLDFSKGIVDAGDLVFFLTGTALFLAVAVKILESRKWR